jgi:lipoprotein-anchoring transpeptidase ErfK/SrfK
VFSLRPPYRSLLTGIAVVAIAAGAGTVLKGIAPGQHSAKRPVSVVETGPAPESGPGSPGTSLPATPAADPTTVRDPSQIATATVPSLPLYRSPGAPSPDGTLPNPNYLGASLVLLVRAVQNDWVDAYVPQRPNGATAWVPAADVKLGSVPCHIQVAIGARNLVLYCNNAPVFNTVVATGAPDSPTPTGFFFVSYIVKLTDPGGPYGPYALATSAFSNTYYNFEGGPGQVAIHGTDQPSVIGTYASHGCVRLTNTAITTLAQQVAAGTPVQISS